MAYFLVLLPVVIFASIVGRNPRAETPVAWFVVYFMAFLLSGLFLGIVFSDAAWKWGAVAAGIALAIRWGVFGWFVRLTSRGTPKMSPEAARDYATFKEKSDSLRDEEWMRREATIKGTWREWVVSLCTVTWIFCSLVLGFTMVIGAAVLWLGDTYATFQRYGIEMHAGAVLAFVIIMRIGYPIIRRKATLAVTGYGRQARSGAPDSGPSPAPQDSSDPSLRH